MAIAPNPLSYNSTGTKLVADQMYNVDSFRWVSPTAAAADRCLVVDSGGNTLYDAYAQGAQFIDVMRRPPTPFINGLAITTISSGILYVYFK